MRHSKRAVPKVSKVSKVSLTRSSDLLLQRRDLLDPFAVGSWTPHMDLCKAENRILVRAELPGVAAADIRLTFMQDTLRLQGIKRDNGKSRRLVCYYCLERRFGKFDRSIKIGAMVNPEQIQATLAQGILTVEIPTLKDRRGVVREIPIKKK